MSLWSILVDRARLLSREATGKTAGETQFGWVAGPWFAARVGTAAQPETEEPGAGRVRVQSRPILTFATYDDGTPILITTEHRIETDSRDLGTGLWDVDNDPSLFRTKETVIGGEVTLKRVVDHPRLVASA